MTVVILAIGNIIALAFRVYIRHEYYNCPYLPKFLLKEDGVTYKGPVYVIGVITRIVRPGSREEREIAETKLGNFYRSGLRLCNFCEVSWQRMGMKWDLKEETKNYIRACCPPTLVQICQNPEQRCKKSSLTHYDIRFDLWQKATIPIGPNDFPEVFDFQTTLNN